MKFINSLKEIEVQKQVSALESDVNSLAFNVEREVEPVLNDPNLLNSLTKIAIAWISYYGNPAPAVNIWRDARNEAAIAKCQEIFRDAHFSSLRKKYIGDTDFTRDVRKPKEEQYLCRFMEEAGNMHRTLMQTATKLMLYTLSLLNDSDAVDLVANLQKKYGREYYSLPLI